MSIIREQRNEVIAQDTINLVVVVVEDGCFRRQRDV
jgi:hypothetical protein